ncbi:MAG: hypothetical protein ACXV76_13115 [Halobacteriota archaeon]
MLPKRTKRFTRELEKFRRKDSQTYRRIEMAIEALMLDPDGRLNHRLGTTLKGYRAFKVNDDLRIRFVICRECREQNVQDRCIDCDDTPDDQVLLLSVGHHKDVY